jgi:hypothetical protein
MMLVSAFATDNHLVLGAVTGHPDPRGFDHPGRVRLRSRRARGCARGRRQKGPPRQSGGVGSSHPRPLVSVVADVPTSSVSRGPRAASIRSGARTPFARSRSHRSLPRLWSALLPLRCL